MNRIPLWWLILFPSWASAQDTDDRLLAVQKQEAKVAFVEFHVIPELGLGLFFDEELIEVQPDNWLGLVRFPGIVLPNLNQTATGFQLEFAKAPSDMDGVNYSIWSYTRTKVAGPVYTGLAVRIMLGNSSIGGNLDAETLGILGFDFFTVFDTAKFSIETQIGKQKKAFVVVSF